MALPEACLPHAVTIRSYGLNIRLAAGRRDVLDRLMALAPPLHRRVDSERVHRSVAVRAKGRCACGSVHDVHEAWEQGQAFANAEPELDVLLDLLRQRVKMFVAEFSPRRVFVHAGVVGWQGQAIVLPGRSYAGKTTLVRALLELGATYLSDEYAVIDRKGLVHPYPQPLGVRHAVGASQREVSAESMGATIGTTPLPVGLVVVTQHQSGVTWTPEPIGRGRAVFELISHTVPFSRSPQRAMAFLERALVGSTALLGPRGEARDTAMAILGDVTATRTTTSCGD